MQKKVNKPSKEEKEGWKNVAKMAAWRVGLLFIWIGMMVYPPLTQARAATGLPLHRTWNLWGTNAVSQSLSPKAHFWCATPGHARRPASMASMHHHLQCASSSTRLRM
eukprot:6883207-Prymnesium_polylepis.2